MNGHTNIQVWKTLGTEIENLTGLELRPFRRYQVPLVNKPSFYSILIRSILWRIRLFAGLWNTCQTNAEFVVDKSGMGSYPSTSDFPRQYHSTIVPCSYLIHL